MKDNTLKVKKVRFYATKFNKTNVIYSGECNDSNILTEVIKIEKFQGFSKVFNVDYYLRVKDRGTWKESTPVTGLFKCNKSLWFSGDYIKGLIKTSILFMLKPDMSELLIHEFQSGVYLSKNEIENYLKSI